MRIAFIGPHGVGKTTVCQRISEALGLPLITERAREVARNWGLTPATIPADRLVEYQWTILRQQVLCETSLHNVGFVSDRSTIDNMAYWVSVASKLEVPWPTIEAYNQLAYTRLEHYDLLIHIPVMFPMALDGERHPDPTFQQEIAGNISDLLLSLDVRVSPGLLNRVYTVKTEGVERRIPEILAAIEAARSHHV